MNADQLNDIHFQNIIKNNHCITFNITIDMMVVKIEILLTLFCVAASQEVSEYLFFSKTCNAGDVTENECNKCICSKDKIIWCKSKPCNDNAIPDTKHKPSCHPNTLYVRNSTVCLCNETGSWPDSNCETIFGSFHKKMNQDCKPNSYVLIDCNVCKCGPNGKLDKDHCTKNECKNKDKTETRRFIHQNQVYGNCKARNWYSLAPCQFCYCVNENKLICNTGNNHSKKLKLGSYNFSICGKDLVKDAVRLVPEGENTFLRYGNKKVSTVNKPREEENPVSIELSHGINEKGTEELIDKKLNETEEYYSDSEEVKAPMPLDRKGLSTQSLYDEKKHVVKDMRDPSGESDSDVIMSLPLNAAQSLPSEVLSRESSAEPIAQNHLKIEQKHVPHHMQWSNPERLVSMSGVKQQVKAALNLGDVLKPYLPEVLNKVFKMAVRKSMVSLETNSNCTPGSTTMLKCNTCFCLKNSKLLCTKHKCNKTNMN